jgi:hypothetical protein
MKTDVSFLLYFNFLSMKVFLYALKSPVATIDFATFLTISSKITSFFPLLFLPAGSESDLREDLTSWYQSSAKIRGDLLRC